MPSHFGLIMEKTAEISKLSEKVGVSDLFQEIVLLLDQSPSVKALVWYQNDLGHICVDYGGRATLPWEMGGFTLIVGKLPEMGPRRPGRDYFDDLYVEPPGVRAKRRDFDRVNEFLNSLPEKLLAEFIGTDVVVFAWRGGILARGISQR